MDNNAVVEALRSILEDGYLSDTNTARGHEALKQALAQSAQQSHGSVAGNNNQSNIAMNHRQDNVAANAQPAQPNIWYSEIEKRCLAAGIGWDSENPEFTLDELLAVKASQPSAPVVPTEPQRDKIEAFESLRDLLIEAESSDTENDQELIVLQDFYWAVHAIVYGELK